MVVAASRPIRAIVPALLAALLAAGCSTKQTSPAQTCDSQGVDLVAFASDRGHHGQYDIYLYDIDNAGYRLLRNLNSSAANDSSPALSGDDQLVAFVTTRGATGSDIVLYARNACGFLDTPGLNSAGDETDPVFSGDLKRLAFVRDTLGHRRIRMIDATGSVLALVALPGLDSLNAPYDDWSPAPDLTGNGLVFVSNRDGRTHLYFYDRDSLRIDPLVGLRDTLQLGTLDIEPSFTPDRHFVCFASNRPGGAGGFDLYLYSFVNRSFATVAAGVNTSGDERHPSINPSANVLAYQSRTSATAPWNVRYVFLNTSPAAISTIGRMDSTASDVQPSIVFP